MKKTTSDEKSLVLELCANYFAKSNGFEHYCYTVESKRCVFFDSNVTTPYCRYFEESVRPMPPRR